MATCGRVESPQQCLHRTTSPCTKLETSNGGGPCKFEKRLTRQYVLATDAGMAPCVDNNMLTLSCCKPMIRKHSLSARSICNRHAAGLLRAAPCSVPIGSEKGWAAG
ncbi:hypothetical protein [Burkholderia ubonensis]|uniref:Nmad2 family putative nucleotide modification protein n=1 Tax=Burkholderia ubonensis TaxID=101571 RepID=UPI0039F5AAE9